MFAAKKSFFTLIVITLLSLVFTFPSAIRAQEVSEQKTPYEEAYKAYLDQMSVYQTVHQEYILKRSQYESFKTLQAQQDAQSATVKMLQERDQVVVNYLQALKEKVVENPGLSTAEKDALVVKVETEITWFTDHKNNIPTAGSLTDLSEDSSKASKEFTAMQTTVYKALASISDGKLTDVSTRFNDRFTELKDKVVEIRSETREEYIFSSDKLLRLDRWIFDAQSRMDRASAKQVDAQKTIQLLGTSSRTIKSLPDAYATVLKNLGESQQYLKEAGGFLLEIIRDIKTAED